jgi:hypothetical protein
MTREPPLSAGLMMMEELEERLLRAVRWDWVRLSG